MCRILLSTATAKRINTHVGLSVFDRMMLYMQEAGNNTDGAGFAYNLTPHDGATVLKSPTRYSQQNLSWFDSYNGGPFLAHLRNATVGTELSMAATHPFYFKDEDKDGVLFNLIGVHNGSLPATKSMPMPAHAPSSDSWRAFLELAYIIKEESVSEMGARMINEWIGRVGLNGAFVIVFYANDKFYIFRNTQRYLYAAPYEDGLLFNTDKDVLTMGLKYSERRYGIKDTSDKIMLLPDRVLYTVGIGEGCQVDVDSLTYPYSYVSSTTSRYEAWDDEGYYGAAGRRNRIITPSTSTTQEVRTVGGNFLPEEEKTTGTSVILFDQEGTTNDSETEDTREEPEKESKFEVIRTPSSYDDLNRSQRIWNKLRARLSPMSMNIMEIWLSLNNGTLMEEERLTTWLAYSPDQIVEFNNYLHMRRASNANRDGEVYETNSLLSVREQRLMTLWNNKVRVVDEYATYKRMFSDGMFFLDMSMESLTSIFDEMNTSLTPSAF